MKKVASVFLLIVWLLLIFGLSHENGDASSRTSEEVVRFFVQILTDIEDDSEEMQRRVEKYSFPVRKLAHFTEYFILGVIVLNCFASFNVRKRILLYTSVFCIVVAILDEYHQSFIDGRGGNIVDVLLDSSGSLIGCYVVARFYLLKDYYRSIF